MCARRDGHGSRLGPDHSFLDAAVTDTERNARRHVGDLMQLAHYYALLDAAGIASPGWFVAGVCGTEGVIVWHDLSEPNLPPPDHVDGDPDVCLSALARYNFEFTYRLGIFAAAEDHLATRRHRCWPSPLCASSATCAVGGSGAVTGSRRCPT